MSVHLIDSAELFISEADLAAILTAHFCDSYGAFKRVHVKSVSQADSGSFSLMFTPLPIPGTPNESTSL